MRIITWRCGSAISSTLGTRSPAASRAGGLHRRVLARPLGELRGAEREGHGAEHAALRFTCWRRLVHRDPLPGRVLGQRRAQQHGRGERAEGKAS
jgi:hypothetical protein